MKVLVLVICALAVCDAMPVEKVQPGSTLVTANWELYKVTTIFTHFLTFDPCGLNTVSIIIEKFRQVLLGRRGRGTQANLLGEGEND